MAEDYTADYSAAASVAGDMAQASRDLQSLVDEMNQTVVQVLLDWDDEAKAAYTQDQTRWNQAATNMWNQLSTAEQALGQIMEAYQKAEQTGVAIFGG